jgi:hypothetical protein
MKPTLPLLALVCLLAAAPACKTTQTSVINSVYYDEPKNNTVLMLLPYGNITLPGKWKETSVREDSRQHFFSNEDTTVHIAVTKNPRRFYPFNQKQHTDREFTHHFVAWDTAYFQQTGRPTQIVADSSENGFILFDVVTPSGDIPKTLFLYGTKNGIVFNFSGRSAKWPVTQMQSLLIRLFHDN